jgi:sigma-B regulation protein RsbU (phosphoserine phosphatase)
VHESMLPKPVRHERIDVDVRYLPIKAVGGDYCQLRITEDSRCYITMCDVTGHGIGPALLATRVSSEVRHGILSGLAPRQIVDALNGFIIEQFQGTELYLTFIAARIDLEERSITYCGAGHPSPLLIRQASGEVLPLESRIP